MNHPTDLTVLHDAFADLEARADAAPAQRTLLLADRSRTTADRPGVRRASRPVLIGVTAVALLAVTGGVVLATRPGAGGGTTERAAAASGSATASPTDATPTASTPSNSASPPTGTGAVAGYPVTNAQLAARLQTVLGTLATISVYGVPSGTPSFSPPDMPSDPPPPASSGPTGSAVPTDPSAGDGATAVPDAGATPFIAGILTAAGMSGGFDLQVYLGTPGQPSGCSSDVRCTIVALPDGATFSYGRAPLLAADADVSTDDASFEAGTSYELGYARADGTQLIMGLSDQQDPKGLSPKLSPAPPLTIDQLQQVLTSPLWWTTG